MARISPTIGAPIGTIRAVDQNASEVAGTAETSDQFGSAVSSMHYDNRPALLIGGPGEDVSSIRDAGTVQAVSNGASWSQKLAACPAAPKPATGWGHCWAACCQSGQSDH